MAIDFKRDGDRWRAERDGRVVGFAKKVTEQGYGHGLATTVERSHWQAFAPDGRFITAGRTRALAIENMEVVLAAAKAIRERTKA